MSSINPVLLFPHALANRAQAIGEAFAGSLTLAPGSSAPTLAWCWQWRAKASIASWKRRRAAWHALARKAC